MQRRALIAFLVVTVSTVDPLTGGHFPGSSYVFAEEEQTSSPDRAVLLNTNDPEKTTKVISSGILLRELVRQAVLIAARDEMGLTTADRTLLRHPFPKDDDQIPLDVVSGLLVRHRMHVVIYPRDPDEFDPLLEETLPLDDKHVVASLTSEMEKLSRSRFIDVLTKAGYRRREAVADADVEAVLSEETKRDLRHLSFLRQFAAVRRIHRRMQKAGPSADVIAGLSRGYANLGTLTEYHWSPAHKVFKARALLYAERLVNTTNSSRPALWNRAYVRALVGLPGLAERDIQTSRQGPAAGNREEPAWLEIVEAYCQYDESRLTKLGESGVWAGLARFLILLETEREPYAARTSQAAAAVLEKFPDCFRAVDTIAGLNRLSLSRAATGLGPRFLNEVVYDRVLEVDDLPVGIRREVERLRLAQADLGDDEVLPQLVKALKASEAADNARGEPSLQVLGRLIEETVFVQSYRRLYFLRRLLSVDTAAEYRRLQPLVADHPYAPILKLYDQSGGIPATELNKLFGAFDPTEFELSNPWLPREQYLEIGKLNRVTPAWTIAYSHHDEILNDLNRVLVIVRPGSVRGEELARRMYEIAPGMPAAIVIRLMAGLDESNEQIQQWQDQFGSNPAVMLELGDYYWKHDKNDEALHWYRKLVAVAPEKISIRRLANLYKEREEFDLWIETSEKLLEQPALGLEHAQIRVDLARYFMRKKQWEKAKPYAVAAAGTGAAWAMLCAAECLTQLEEWDEAEQYMRSTSGRYTSQAFSWFFWCHEHGHGDSEAAAQFTALHIEGLGANPGPEWLTKIFGFHLLNGDPEQAFATLADVDRGIVPRSICLHMALLADSFEKPRIRDSFLQRAVDGPRLEDPTERDAEGNRIIPKARQLALEFQAAFRTPEKRKLDLNRIDQMLRSGQPGEATRLWYYVAMYLELQSDREGTIEYLQRCATSPVADFNRTLARASLRAAGIKVGPTRESEHERKNGKPQTPENSQE